MVNLSTKEASASSPKTNNHSGHSLSVLLHKLNGDKQAENVLKETFDKVERAKQEWESTVDALPELICIIDGNGRVLRSNRTIEKWQLGNVKSVIGSSYHDLIHANCASPCYLGTAICRSSLDGEIVEQEIYDEILDRYISLRVHPVNIDSDTAPNHYVVILKDISIRKRAERALQRQNGRLITLNAINKAILAADSPEEIAGAALKRIQSFIPYARAHLLIKSPETDKLCVLAAINKSSDCALETGQEITEAMFNHPGNPILEKFCIVQSIPDLAEHTEFEKHLLTQHLNAYMNVPLKAGDYTIGTLQLAAVNTDLFQPEQIEVIQEIVETLTIAIQQSQLHQKLGRTNDELQRILRTKHEIMQDVSHDLRSPLALIKGYTELLKDEFMGPLTEEQTDALKIIDKKSEQLLILVNRLFHLQTIGKEILDKAPLNLAVQLSEVAQSWQILATNKNIGLRTKIQPNLPIIMADPNLLDQVFTNLLDNALKFSPEGSRITISARIKGNHLVVTVADEGQGIAPEKAAQIFDRFYQDKSNRQAKSGAGIGLALCKAIVDAHDGRIWAESAGTNQGTTFFIALPITKIEKPAA